MIRSSGVDVYHVVVPERKRKSAITTSSENWESKRISLVWSSGHPLRMRYSFAAKWLFEVRRVFHL